MEPPAGPRRYCNPLVTAMYSSTENHKSSPVYCLLFTVRVSGGGLKNHDSTHKSTASPTGSTLHCRGADTDILIQPHTKSKPADSFKKGLISWHRSGLAVIIKSIPAVSEPTQRLGLHPERVICVNMCFCSRPETDPRQLANHRMEPTPSERSLKNN